MQAKCHVHSNDRLSLCTFHWIKHHSHQIFSLYDIISSHSEHSFEQFSWVVRLVSLVLLPAWLCFETFSLLQISISLQCYAMSWRFQLNISVTNHHHRHRCHHQLLASVYFYGDGRRVDGKCCSITYKSNKIQLKWNACFTWSTWRTSLSACVCVNGTE